MHCGAGMEEESVSGVLFGTAMHPELSTWRRRKLL